jgi:hypothetical protein
MNATIEDFDMSIKNCLIFILPLLIFTACSHTGPHKPDWIDGQANQYPAQAYLSGYGQSEYRAIAQDRARADLSKIFQVNIYEQSEDKVAYQGQKTADGQQETLLLTDSSRIIATQTEQIVSGIRIAEIWQDPQNQQYHALAILDRIKMSNSLRQTIDQQDIAIEKEITQSQRQNELLIKIGHASQALTLQKAREANQNFLVIIDPAGIGVPPRYHSETLHVDRNALLNRLHIAIEVTPTSMGDIQPIVSGALAHAGFQHEKDPSKANYVLITELKVDQHQDNEGWYWYRGTLQVSLKNIETQQQSGSHRWEIKVSAQQPELAKQRVMNAVDTTLKTELRQIIIQFGYPD